jgi:hypothetical protein
MAFRKAGGKVFIPPGTVINTALPEWKWLEGVVPPINVEVTPLNQRTAEWLRSVRKPRGE